MKSLQFEVWQECSQQCSFCYLGTGNRHTPDDRKLLSLRNMREKIHEPGIFEKYDNISMIGGEFFQGQMKNPEVKKEFFSVLEEVAGYLRDGKISSSWLSATLTRPASEDLFRAMDLFSDICPRSPSGGLWLITSYDAFGRFHTPEQEECWRKNVRMLKEKYPYLKVNTTIILSQRMVEDILSGKFDFRKFTEEMGTNLFVKQPSPGYGDDPLRDRIRKVEARIPGFFPKRKDFIRMLRKVASEWPEFYAKLFNIEFRADDLFRNFNEDPEMQLIERHKKEKAEMSGVELAPCGHVLDYSTYLDSDRCMLCDKLKIQDLFGQ